MAAETTSIRVLLIDDQFLVRAALGELVAGAADIEVVATAGSVAEAVCSSVDAAPNVALWDAFTDPGGLDAGAELARRWPDIRTVVLDDAVSDANVHAVLRFGASGYLTKQQPLEEIHAAVRDVARGERVFAPDVARRLVFSAEGVHLTTDKSHPLASLTPREQEVLIHLAQGYSVKECAKSLGIGVSTAANHKSRLMKKLGVHKAVALARLAVREGLIPTGQLPRDS